MRHRLSGSVRRPGAALSIGLALAGGAVASGAEAQVRLVEAGIVCPREPSGALVEAPGTEAGVLRQVEEGLAFDVLSRTVPMIDDLAFGVRVELKAGTPPLSAVVVVTHPPMGPRGVTREEWPDALLPGGQSVNLFTFEQDYEKVPGRWTFGLEVEGEPVVTVAFDVLAEGGQGPVEQVCFTFLS